VHHPIFHTAAILKVVRTAGATLNNANAGVGIAATTLLRIDNYDDYLNNHDDATNYTYAAKNPGSWGNGLKVCFIDDAADQIVGIATTNPSALGATIGFGVTANLSAVTIPGLGSTSTFTGYLKGIITGVTTDTTNGASSIDVKILSRVSSAGTTAGTETKINYAEGSSFASYLTTSSLRFVNNSGITTGGSATAAVTPTSVTDWYESQTLGLTNATIFWRSLAPKPISNQYTLERQGYGDGLHVVVVDDLGSITGNQGTILETHLGLSKALDSVSSVNSPQKNWYEQYLADFSSQIYAGGNPSSAADAFHGTTPRATGFTTYSGLHHLLQSLFQMDYGDKLHRK
jgi:hypothetical protein